MAVWQAPSRWFLPHQRWLRRPPPGVKGWLDEPGSLTLRLIAEAEGRFAVRLLAQGWARPAPEERQRLHLPAGRYALIREVELLGNGVPWVRARSVLPLASLQGPGRRLRRLGNRSLGGLLFKDPTLRRGPIEIAPLRQREGTVWARRSRLYYHGRPLLVAECFLPALLAAATLADKR
jgi:chorismate--pyruvate lyase